MIGSAGTVGLDLVTAMDKFYYKNKSKKIVPSDDADENSLAESMLNQIKTNHSSSLPQEFLDRWDEVKLYSPKRNVKNANQILIKAEDGAYSLKNKLNHLTGKKWTIFTCSWFIFNALQSDLAEEKRIATPTLQLPLSHTDLSQAATVLEASTRINNWFEENTK